MEGPICGGGAYRQKCASCSAILARCVALGLFILVFGIFAIITSQTSARGRDRGDPFH